MVANWKNSPTSKVSKKHRKRVTNLTWHHSEAVKINLLVSEVLFPQTLRAFQRLVGASLLVDGDAGSAEILTAPRRIHVFIGFNWAWIWILSFQIQRHITTSSILHGSMANSREYIFLLDTVRSPSNIAKGTGANSDSSAMTWTKKSLAQRGDGAWSAPNLQMPMKANNFERISLPWRHLTFLRDTQTANLQKVWCWLHDVHLWIPLLSYGKSNMECGALGRVILNARHHNHCKEKTLESDRKLPTADITVSMPELWSHEVMKIWSFQGTANCAFLFLGTSTTAPHRLTTAAVVWKTQPAPWSLRDFKGLQKCM